MGCHNLSNELIALDNAKSVEKREMTVWQKMAMLDSGKRISVHK